MSGNIQLTLDARLDTRQPAATKPRRLTPAVAVGLYRGGMSACEIAQAYKLTRGGVEARIRAGGLGGNHWCPIHRAHEALSLVNAEAVSYMWGAVDAPEWRQAITTEGDPR